MSKLVAFYLTFIVLTIQAIVLIVMGMKFGDGYAVPTFILFFIMNVVLAIVADELKLIDKEY